MISKSTMLKNSHVGKVLFIPLLQLLCLLVVITPSSFAKQNLVYADHFPDLDRLRPESSLNNVVSAEFESTPVLEVLSDVASEAGLRLIYNREKLNSAMTITGAYQKQTVFEILNDISAKTDIDYYLSESGHLILIPSVSELQHSINGTVIDADTGEPLPGVNIVVAGSQEETGSIIGTLTQDDGSYSLTIPGELNTIMFSYIGYETSEIQIDGRSEINVTLQPETITGEELVVVGYGTLRERDLTGSVSQFSTETIENENTTNVQDILRGNIAGLNVGTSTSAKGGGSFEIRGRRSLTAGREPLIVLDGVIYHGSLSDVNPNDIETIEVLKDASSAAVFGANAANGVILINTKTGEFGKPRITFSTNISSASLSSDQPIYSAEEFLGFREDVMRSMNQNQMPYHFSDPRHLPSDISVDDWLAYDASSGDPVTVWLNRLNLKQVEIDNYMAGESINWYDQVFQRGLQQDYNVSLSNRLEDITYYVSLGYQDNEGIVVGDRFSAVRARLNLESDVTDFLTIGANSQFGSRDESQVPASWSQMVNVSPWGSYYADDGVTLRRSPHDDPAISSHPFLSMRYTDRAQNYTNFNSNVYARVQLPFGAYYQFNYVPYVQWYKYLNHQSSQHPTWSIDGGLATRSQTQTYSWQIDNLLKWNNTFNDIHFFDVTLLANAEKFQSWHNRIDAQRFDPSDQLGYHNIGAGESTTVSSSDQYSTGDALMARLHYGLMDRYLITLSVRRDGYSAFGQANPHATFPSASVAWVFTDEPFFNNELLTYAKLRLSYGVNGNRNIGRYAALAGLSSGDYLHADRTGGVRNVKTLEVSRMSNADLKWERTTSLNAGLDFSILSGIVDGSIDAYTMSTSDLLIQRSLPRIVGYNQVLANLGEVRNRGLEFDVTSRNIQTDYFSWSSTVTFSLNRNEIVDLYGDGEDDITNRWFIGEDIDAIWDLNVLGVYQLDQEDEAARYGVEPGDFILEDVDDDGLLTDDDRQFLGHTTPRYRWSLRNSFSYRNLDLSFMIYSQWGHMGTYNQAKNLGNGYLDRTNYYILPYWTPDNPTNSYARLSSSDGAATYNVYTDRSFIRLDNISLGYSLPVNLISQLNLQQARLMVTMRNVGYYAPGDILWDPENAGPTPRVLTVGLNITL